MIIPVADPLSAPPPSPGEAMMKMRGMGGIPKAAEANVDRDGQTLLLTPGVVKPRSVIVAPARNHTPDVQTVGIVGLGPSGSTV